MLSPWVWFEVFLEHHQCIVILHIHVALVSYTPNTYKRTYELCEDASAF